MSFSKAKKIKAKIKQMGPNQNHKILHNKGNHRQNAKTIYSWEKISGNDTTDKGLIFTTYNSLYSSVSK